MLMSMSVSFLLLLLILLSVSFHGFTTSVSFCPAVRVTVNCLQVAFFFFVSNYFLQRSNRNNDSCDGHIIIDVTYYVFM